MEGLRIDIDYISGGSNLFTAAADWHTELGILAYGSRQNIALWHANDYSRGVFDLLSGHDRNVTAVRFVRVGQETLLLSGSSDGHLRVWQQNDRIDIGNPGSYKLQFEKLIHNGSITHIASDPSRIGLFMTGSSDSTVAVWTIEAKVEGIQISRSQTINLKDSFIPLTTAFYESRKNGLIAAIAGTGPDIWIYGFGENEVFDLQTKLAGHEGWIRSLAFTSERTQIDVDPETSPNLQLSDILLASTSQDKYVRLWRIHEIKEKEQNYHNGNKIVQPEHSRLTNRLREFSIRDCHYSMSFEALLAGHDDWVYSARWFSFSDGPRLLTASADNSLAIWELDSQNGIWYPSHRLGDLSNQKGSTSATGSMGGLWNALWGPGGKMIVGLGQTGSWHKWQFYPDEDQWTQVYGISGHSKAVNSISWARTGAYLLSASDDQTTRLHAERKHKNHTSWHEMSRPQIHGYDLKCIDVVNDNSFISGADEKLLRVFDIPDDVAKLISDLNQKSNYRSRNVANAGMPVLGLSNKELTNTMRANTSETGEEQEVGKLPLPPSEHFLAKYSLWPETEKLYGHGFEVNSLAVSHDGLLVATSCRASSIEHAVIRVFSTSDWRQIDPPLRGHSLTVTNMAFSPNNDLLLSVGRDRQWTIWKSERQEGGTFRLVVRNHKAHSRMILAGAWLTAFDENIAFATGGRDKILKVWQGNLKTIVCSRNIEVSAPITCLKAYRITNKEVLLASGFESGALDIYRFRELSDSFELLLKVPDRFTPKGPITDLAWRPKVSSDEPSASTCPRQLAMSSQDNSTRILSIFV